MAMPALELTDIASLLLATGAIITAIRTKRSKTVTKNETVDADVLSQFLGLTDRVADLEGLVAHLQMDLAQAKLDLAQALRELAELQKVEEYLRARLHEKDKELLEVRAAADEKQATIDRLRERVLHLEDVCRRAGINGDEVEERA